MGSSNPIKGGGPARLSLHMSIGQTLRTALDFCIAFLECAKSASYLKRLGLFTDKNSSSRLEHRNVTGSKSLNSIS